MLNFLSEAISPLSIGFLGIVVLIFLKHRLSRFIFGLLPCFFLLFFSTPLLSTYIQQSLATEFLPQTRVDAINLAVLLGGAVDSSVRPRAQLGPSGDRLLVAKEYYDLAWFDTLLVSGGSQTNQKFKNSSEDRNILISFGIADTDVHDEHDSKTTTQNAINTKEWMKVNPSLTESQSVYLITSALHMRRAMFEFCLQGIDVVPLVANVPSAPEYSKYRKWLPFAGNLRSNSIWFSENLGLLVRRIFSKTSGC